MRFTCTAGGDVTSQRAPRRPMRLSVSGCRAAPGDDADSSRRAAVCCRAGILHDGTRAHREPRGDTPHGVPARDGPEGTRQSSDINSETKGTGNMLGGRSRTVLLRRPYGREQQRRGWSGAASFVGLGIVPVRERRHGCECAR